MAVLKITDFPKDLHEKLRVRAEKEHRSVAQQALHLLEEALEKNGEAYSIFDLRGLGKDLWRGENAAEYVKRERDSWDS